MAKKMVRRKAREVLRDGDMETDNLVESINKLLKHGTTASELGNILARNPEFESIGTDKRVANTGRMGGSYSVCVWHLTSET